MAGSYVPIVNWRVSVFETGFLQTVIFGSLKKKIFANLCILSSEFRPFTFNVIIALLEFKSGNIFLAFFVVILSFSFPLTSYGLLELLIHTYLFV
jgi:hypothetical protein